MQDMQTVIALLSVIVVILSVVVLTLLGLIIAAIVKLKKIMNQVDVISNNLVQATEWLAPAKIVSEIVKLFRK